MPYLLTSDKPPFIPPQLTENLLSRMSTSFRRVALQRAARIFDLAVLNLTFLAAFAISSDSYTWLSFQQVLVLRIKVVNVLLFGGYLALCSAIMSRCGFYLTHRLSRWTSAPARNLDRDSSDYGGRLGFEMALQPPVRNRQIFAYFLAPEFCRSCVIARGWPANPLLFSYPGKEPKKHCHCGRKSGCCGFG